MCIRDRTIRFHFIIFGVSFRYHAFLVNCYIFFSLSLLHCVRAYIPLSSICQNLDESKVVFIDFFDKLLYLFLYNIHKLLAVFIFLYSFISFNFYLCKRLHLFMAYKLNFPTFSIDFKLKKVHRTFLSYAWQQKAVSVSLLYLADFCETAFHT